MNRQLSTLLLGLLLLVATACDKKKDPEPEPMLDGTWLRTHEHSIEYNTDGTVLLDTGKRALHPASTFTFSGTTLKITPGSFGEPPLWTYSRTGNTLVYYDLAQPSYTITYQIQELTKTNMQLVADAHSVRGGTYHITYFFTRQ